MILVSVFRRYQFLDPLNVLVNFFGNVSLSFQHRSLDFFSFSFFPAYYLQSPFSSKEGSLSAIFDSQIENF